MKRHSENNKWIVFNLLLDYFDERTVARFRCVSKTVKDIIPKHIKPPKYHALIDDFYDIAQQNEFVSATSSTIYMTYTKSAGVKFILQKYDILNEEDDRVEFKIRSDNKDHKICLCAKDNLKKILYRCLKANKKEISLFFLTKIQENYYDLEIKGVKILDLFNNISIYPHKRSFSFLT